MIIVTGCPRSGTMYIAELLQALGKDVRHECMGLDGTSDWRLIGGDLATLQIPDNQPHASIMIIRNPTKSIASMSTLREKSTRLLRRRVGVRGTTDKTLSSMIAWAVWNELGEKKVHKQNILRIEDISSGGPSFEYMCSRCDVEPNMKILNGISKTTNSRKHKSLSAKQLRKISRKWYDRIAAISKRYGYEI